MSAVVDGVRMTAVLQQPGYEEERLQRAAERLPCREVQARMLLSLMGEVGMLIMEDILYIDLHFYCDYLHFSIDENLFVLCCVLPLQPGQYSFPSIFIYGHQASGKSYVMQVLLKELEVTAGPDV